MSFANRMQGVASKLLDKFDESKVRLKLIKPAGEPVWDETLAEMVPQESEQFDLVGVTTQFSAAMINGTTIQAGDVMVIAKVNQLIESISVQDKVLIDGVQWSITQEPKVDYTALTICYKIHCRK